MPAFRFADLNRVSLTSFEDSTIKLSRLIDRRKFLYGYWFTFKDWRYHSERV